ncbi:MAG: hypothetical protein GXP62_06490 [Oligoflexia bacterium]|nr:hypothetical protein [Oligoflexia bacterium]
MLLALFLTVLPAHATELVARWDQPVRYHAEALIHTPNGQRYIGWVNYDVTAAEQEISVDLDCDGKSGSRGFDVICTIDKVALGGAVFVGKQRQLDAIFVEYQGYLQGQTVQLTVARDGRVTGVDLEGVDKRDDRMAQIHESLRQLLRRVFAPLDLGLPKKEVQPSGTWKQKGTPLFFQLLTSYGTAGGSVVKHTLLEVDGDSALISTQGRGNLATGQDWETSAASRDIVRMVGAGSGRFDIAAGLVSWRQVSVSGELTGSSPNAGVPIVYTLAAWAGRIGADGKVDTGAAPPQPTQQ